MEEDIKILEEYLKPRLNAKTHLGYEVVRYPELEAIDNLVKGYRELEEIKNSKLDEYLHNNLWICKDLSENYIHKSKIKEKIEEYKQEMKEIRAKEKGLIWNHRLHKLDYGIQVLQELMEDK